VVKLFVIKIENMISRKPINSKKENLSEYQRFQGYLKRLNEIYLEALRAFCAWESLKEQQAPNVVGKDEARSNFKIIDKFGGFFFPAERSLLVSFSIGLAKFFEDDKQSLNLNKLIKFAKSHRKRINSRGKELAVEYLEGLESDLREIYPTVAKLKKFRDESLAHEGLRKKNISPIVDEARKIFGFLEIFLNSLSLETDFSTTNYEGIRSDCKGVTEAVINHLRRFEPYRINECKEKLNKLL
jgi:hypothetical protein